MDGDLWDWPYDQGLSFSDAYESSYSVESGWQADFYYGNGKDVIDENAMNEKYCIQVLKILIRKGDAEINDLEEDLLLLQCGLTWTESRNQFETCCNALREKIDVLDNSINSLRQSDKINTDDQLPLHRQPAEKLYEILKPFLGEGHKQDDGQDQHATLNSQSTDTAMQLVGSFCESSSISAMKVKSEEMEVKNILLAVDTIPNDSVQKHKENDGIRIKEVKPGITVEICSNALVTEENGCLKPDILKPVSKVKIEEAKKQRINNPCKSRKLKSASNLVCEHGLLKAQKHGKSVVEKANSDVPRQSDGFCGKKRSFDPNSNCAANSKSGNCKVEEKLIDYWLRKKNKSDMGPVLPESNGSASSCLSSNTKGMVDRNLQVSEAQKSGAFDTSNFFIMLLTKIQEQQGNDMVRTQTKETDKLLLEDSQNVENVSHEKLDLYVGHQAKAFTRKGQSKSHTSISKPKKHRNPGAIGDSTCSDLPLEQKVRVKSVEPCQLKVEMQDDALDIEKNLGPSSQNKGTSKVLVGHELIDLSFVDDISGSDQIKPDSQTGEDKQMAKSCTTTDDRVAKILALLPSLVLILKKSSLVDLRIIAKEVELTKYHKLRKSVLLDQLVSQLKSDLLVGRLKSKLLVGQLIRDLRAGWLKSC